MNPAAFVQSPRLAQLVREAPLNELGPGQRRNAVCDQLVREPLTELFAPELAQGNAARACVAGLLLMYDGLHDSHAISQELDDASGSYWHGIMHRREPDYGNAKYWFTRVRRHAIYPQLAEAARELARATLARQAWPAARWLLEQEPWSAERFVDLCKAATQADVAATNLCRQIQQCECELLLDYCYQAATKK